jgi:prevent-host-death family protein
MRSVALFDAKTHFSNLISDVDKRKHIIIITKRGEKVAKITPFDHDKKRPVAEVIKDMDLLNKEIRKHVKVSLKEIMEMREEGRK